MPETITQLSDGQLVTMVKDEASSEAFVEICRRYENVFYKVCQKYIPKLEQSGVSSQDIFDEKTFILYHCIQTYDPTKRTKLSTWIGNYARYLCLNSINARRLIVQIDSDEMREYIESHQKAHEPAESAFPADACGEVYNLLKTLDDTRILRIFALRYGEGKKMTWAAIAERLGVSTQTVINLHAKGVSILRRKIQR